MPANEKDGIKVMDPKSDGERKEVAGTCVKTLGLTIPCLVDGIDNKVEQAWAGWPDRMYVIDTDGKIVYKGEPGPRGFRPREMEAALKKTLGETDDKFATPEDRAQPKISR